MFDRLVAKVAHTPLQIDRTHREAPDFLIYGQEIADVRPLGGRSRPRLIVQPKVWRIPIIVMEGFCFNGCIFSVCLLIAGRPEGAPPLQIENTQDVKVLQTEIYKERHCSIL